MTQQLLMKSAILPLALLALGFSSGCSQRREALGGGALTPVRVTLLTEGGSSGGTSNEAEAGPATIAGYGTFRGRVVVKGTVPQLAPLLAKGAVVKDAVCTLKAVPNESVEVGPGGGLANAYVFIKQVPRGAEVPAPPSDPFVLDQEGCKFVPHAGIVRVGQPIHMINSDPVAHNVQITEGLYLSYGSTIPGGDKTGLTINAPAAERKPVKLSCSFHGWMSGTLFPVDSPWAVLTGPDGSFEIKGVPAGKMEFVVWQEKAQYIERSFAIDIPVDGVAEHTFEVDASKLQ